MGDVNTNYKVNVGVDDAKWQEFVKSVSTLQSAFGGATKAAVESAQKIASVAAESASKQISSKKQIIDVDEKAAAAMQRNIERQVKENQKAAAQIESFVAKENAAKEKASAAAERLAKKEADTNAREAMRAANARAKEYQKSTQSAQKAAAAAEKAAQKVADAEIKSAQKAAAAIEKEEEKKQAYLLKLRMKSIQDANKAEEKAAKSHGSGAKEHGGGGHEHSMLAEVGEVALLYEGLKKVTEASEEAAQSQKSLQAGTGFAGEELKKAGEAAEEIGNKYAISGEKAKIAMGKTASYTHASGEELNKQTEAVIAYGIAHGKSEEMVAKKMATDQGRAEILAEGQANIAKATAAANTPAANMARIQNTIMETVGKLAMIILDALGPALKVIAPILAQLGTLVGTILKEALTALQPAIKMIGDLFTQLAPTFGVIAKIIIEAVVPAINEMLPIIMDLVKMGMAILLPIITDLGEIFKALVPPLIKVVEVIISALMPVFNQLMPIIAEVAKIITDVLVQNAGMLTDILMNVLVPIIRDSVAPILMSLMPIFRLIGDMIKGNMPIIQTLMKIFISLATTVIPPLVKWLSGGLVKAIDAVVAVVTAAIKVVNAVVGAFKSLLGMGDDAAVAATKKTVVEVNDAEKEGLEKSIEQGEAYHKEKKVNAEAAARKEKKSAIDAAKAQADELLAATKEQIAAEDITDRQAKAESRTAEMVHAQSLVEITKKYNGEKSKEYQAAKLKLQALKNADAKEDRADRIADAKKITDDQLTELELRATNENLSAKELQTAQYKIQIEGMNAEIALQKKGSEEEAKLLQQRGLMVAKHALEVRKETLAISAETNKLVIDNQKEFLALQIQQLKVFGKDSSVADKQLSAIEEKEEDVRYKEELEKRKEQGQALHNADNTLNSLGEQLEAQHQLKLASIRDKAYQQDKDKLAKNFSFLVSGYAGLSSQIDNKFFKPMSDKWFGQNEIAKSVFSDLTSRALKWIAGVIEKQAMALAEQLGFIATSTATTTAAGAASAAAWTPAAIAASIATLGTADAAGTAAYAAAQAAGVGLTLIPHADGAVFTSPAFTRYGGALHSTAENSPEMALPLSSSRAQSIIQNTFGFDKSLNRVVEGLSRIESHVSKTKVVLPINDSFENSRNNYLKSEDRRSI